MALFGGGALICVVVFVCAYQGKRTDRDGDEIAPRKRGGARPSAQQSAYEEPPPIKLATVVTLHSTGSPSRAGAPVTFTANVRATGLVPPSGTVTFLNGATMLGTAKVNGGVAKFTTPLPAGTYSITGRYGGDVQYAESASPALAHKVEPAAAQPEAEPPPEPKVAPPTPQPPRPPARREPVPPLTPTEKTQLKALMKKLESKKSAERKQAAESLREMGQRAQEALRPLCRAMLDKSPEVSAAAADAVERIDPQLHKVALSLILDVFKGGALERARKLQGYGEPLAPILLQLAATTGELSILKSTLEVLTEIAPEDPEVAGLARLLLRHTHVTIRDAAVTQLRGLKHARVAVGELLRMARGEVVESIRIDAIQTLGEIADAGTAPEIVKTLMGLRFDPSPPIRDAVRKALERIRKE
jgi:hypothetical protein